ncbi:MAG: gliding motility lipoprotein GldH [Cytophagaceae bacterium]|jgi:gliding motility-associated lipoprotein GldH|nr:gliding motility lipoprotein GldH [Cytophagaceae bacterium]
MKAATISSKGCVLVILLLAVFVCSCNSHVLYEKEKTFDAGWKMDSAAVFDVAVGDTSRIMDFILTFSHTDDYPCCNLWLFASVENLESNRIETDTIELYMADYDGRWFGKKSGDVFNVSTYYRHHVKMAETGNYRFSFRQGMRFDNLQSIKVITLTITN